jgi:hypothetical protein
VEEAIIVGVDDEEFGQRVAAAVVLKNVSSILFSLKKAPMLTLSSRAHGYVDSPRAATRPPYLAVKLQVAYDAPRRSRAEEDVDDEDPKEADQGGIIWKPASGHSEMGEEAVEAVGEFGVSHL